jgi:hypothetical protein
MDAVDLRRYERSQILSGMTQYGKTGFGSNINLDARSLDRLPSAFLSDPTGYTFTTSPYAPTAEYESTGYTGQGMQGSGRGASPATFYLFKKKPDRFAELQAEQQRLAGIQQQAYETQQADIAKQLKIVQEEKSAVSKMQQEYSNMLIAEAEAKKKAQEEERIALQTARANTAMAGRSGALQIQSAGTTPRTGGTQQFRRRISQFGTASPYKGLSTIQSGMVNV